MEFKFESKPVSWEQPASVHYEHEAFYRAMLPLMNIAGKFAPLGIARSFFLPRMSPAEPAPDPSLLSHRPGSLGTSCIALSRLIIKARGKNFILI